MQWVDAPVLSTRGYDRRCFFGHVPSGPWRGRLAAASNSLVENTMVPARNTGEVAETEADGAGEPSNDKV